MLLPATSNYLETAAEEGRRWGRWDAEELMLSLPGVQLCYWWAVLQAALHTIATLQQLHSSSCQLHSYSWPGLVLGWCGRGGPGQQLQPSHLYRYHPQQMGGKIVHSFLLCFRPFRFILAWLDPFQSSPHYKIAHNYFSHSNANITAEVQILDKNASKSKIFLPAFYVLSNFFSSPIIYLKQY